MSFVESMSIDRSPALPIVIRSNSLTDFACGKLVIHTFPLRGLGTDVALPSHHLFG